MEVLKFYISVEHGDWIEIAEPIGFDAAKFELRQREGGYGRDVFFSETDYEFSPTVQVNGLSHQFDLIISKYKQRGFETDIRISIEIDGVQYVLGQLDFSPSGMETDLIKFIKCKVIQDTHEAILKRHTDTTIDAYSDKDINGNDIDPVAREKILLQSQVLYKESSWTMPDPIVRQGSFAQFFAPAYLIDKNEIEDTIPPDVGYYTLSDVENPVLQAFACIQSRDLLKGCTLTVNGKWSFVNRAAWVLRIKKGVNFESSQYLHLEDLNVVEEDYTLTLNIPTIGRSEFLYVYVNAQAVSDAYLLIERFDVSLKVNAVARDSVTLGVRLRDLMAQVVKSISGKSIDAPRFDIGQEFYDQYVFTGNDLRNLDKPFNISFKELLEYFPECNIDYQIKPNGDVFFGIEEDFYEDDELFAFDQEALKGYKEYPNNRFAINRITYTYADYEQGKNELQKDSLLGVNTDVEYVTSNKMVEETKEIQVGFARDAFLLEKTRKDAFTDVEDAATEDDDNKFILDTVVDSPIYQVDTFYIQGIYEERNGNSYLQLISDGNINWLLLGMEIFDFIAIESTPNIGSWQIAGITATKLNLFRNYILPNCESGVFNITIRWELDNLERKNRTDEGIGLTNLENPFSNLRFTPRNNLIKYYSPYIRSAFYYSDDKLLRNKKYINGGGVIANFGLFSSDGRQDKDLDTSILAVPYLEPVIFEAVLICGFKDYMAIIEDLMTDRRGYISIIDTEGNIKKGHPTAMVYDYKENILTLTAEKRIIY
jgi:hypothetical protein